MIDVSRSKSLFQQSQIQDRSGSKRISSVTATDDKGKQESLEVEDIVSDVQTSPLDGCSTTSTESRKCSRSTVMAFKAYFRLLS